MLSKNDFVKMMGTNSDITFKNISNSNTWLDNYYRNYKNPNSAEIRMKLFSAYQKLNNEFPRNDTPSGEIRNLIYTIVNAFYNSDRSIMKQNLDSIEDFKLEEISFRCKDILKRMFQTENVVLTFDKTESIKPIRVYLDALQNIDNPILELEFDPLDYYIHNGFYKFKTPSLVNVTIIISLSYIKNLFNSNYGVVTSLIEDFQKNYDTSQINGNNNEYNFGNDYYLQIDKITKRFWKDFLSSFTIALYKDRYRESVYSQIYGILNILRISKSDNYIWLKLNSKDEVYDLLKKLAPLIKSVRLNEDEKMQKLVENGLKPTLIKIITHDICSLSTPSKINALDFYKAIFEPLQTEINTLRAKLNIFETFEGIENFTHVDSNLDDLNENYNYDMTNAIVSSLIIKRMVPIMLLTEFIIGTGFKYNETKTIFGKFLRYTIKIEAIGSTSPILFKGMDKCIQEYKTLIQLIDDLKTIFVDTKVIKYILKILVWNNYLNIFGENKNLDELVNSESENI